MVIVKQMLDLQMYIQLSMNIVFHRMEGKSVLPVKSTMTWNPYTKLQDIILLKTVILIYITVITSNPINILCFHYEHNSSLVSIVTSCWLLWLVSLVTQLKEQVPNKVAQLILVELQEPALNFLLSAWWNRALLRYVRTPPDDLPSPCAGKMLNSKVCGGTTNTLHMLQGYNWHTENSKMLNSKVCGGTTNTPHVLEGYNWHTANSKMLNSKVCGGTTNILHMLRGYNWHTANSKIVLHDWQFGHCSLSPFF